METRPRNDPPCGCCFIIGPHILRRLASSSDRAVAEAAARTMRITQAMNAARAQLRTGIPLTALVRTGLRRQVFNCGGFEDLPGNPVRSEGQPANADTAANEAYDHSGTTWSFYHDVFGRESVDGHGRSLVSSVHYGQNYDNAFWNGQQMVYGDGDNVIFTHFTGALEVIAHELTHGVTQFTAQLPYQDQQGALNESMSDVFGSLVKQWSLRQSAAQADWLIGASILAPGFKGRALRDMANPGTAYNDPRIGRDQQPGHMRDYVHTEDDNGGVHTNSGIPSRAFVLAAKAIGGNAWEIPGRIWYRTLTERLNPQSDFRKCALETVSVARDMFHTDPTIAGKVAQAWIDTGVISSADVQTVSAPLVA